MLSMLDSGVLVIKGRHSHIFYTPSLALVKDESQGTLGEFMDGQKSNHNLPRQELILPLKKPQSKLFILHKYGYCKFISG